MKYINNQKIISQLLSPAHPPPKKMFALKNNEVISNEILDCNTMY